MSLKITWLGQAGLLFEHNGYTVMLDPFFSDCVRKRDPKKYRRSEVPEAFWSIRPDMMIFTHDHIDHYDPETAPHFVNENTSVTVLSPGSVYEKVRHLGGDNNYVRFDPHTSWSEGGLCITAVKAVHSDPEAIGVIIDDGEKKYYVTGDTLYNEDIFEDIPDDIYAVFVPVNGVGNNMNMIDAKRFCNKVNATYVVPFHCGMLDDLKLEQFECENRVIPELYQQVEV